jgi:folate-binding protein YgfZ
MNASLALSGIAHIGYLGCIRVSGTDTIAFLQAQLTSDFATLGRGRARLAGFCSAKGRLQASFVAWMLDDTDVLLVCSSDLLQATLKRMSMFVLRMKCRLTDASAEFPVHGIAGEAASRWLDGCAVWERRDTPRAMAIRLPDAPGHAMGLWIARPTQHQTPDSQGNLTQNDWRWLQVTSGMPWIEARNVDLFVPQMINLELLGGVDFQKGCYPGQEVVARSQYRGTLKRRLFRFESEAAATSGEEVFSSTDPGQPAGVVVNAAVCAGTGRSSALIELKWAALGSGQLHLAHPDGPLLHRRDLPYEVPSASRDPT